MHNGREVRKLQRIVTCRQKQRRNLGAGKNYPGERFIVGDKTCPPHDQTWMSQPLQVGVRYAREKQTIEKGKLQSGTSGSKSLFRL